MPTHVALLRGINLGGRNKVAMADLREVVASLGHTGVSTYIQSGNVLFSTGETDTTALAAALEEAIAGALGVHAGVVVLSRGELAQVVRDNPFPQEANPKAVHAIFRNGDLDQDALDRVAAAQNAANRKGSRDTVQVAGRVLFLHTPDGFGRSELAMALTRTGGTPPAAVTATARNWATVTKLLALCDA